MCICLIGSRRTGPREEYATRSCHAICHVHLLSCHVDVVRSWIPWHVMSCNVMVIACDVIFISCHLCHVMSCPVMSYWRQVISCSCHVMSPSCHVRVMFMFMFMSCSYHVHVMFITCQVIFMSCHVCHVTSPPRTSTKALQGTRCLRSLNQARNHQRKYGRRSWAKINVNRELRPWPQVQTA